MLSFPNAISHNGFIICHHDMNPPLPPPPQNGGIFNSGRADIDITFKVATNFSPSREGE
jgi:hypothetical protein